MEVLRSWWDDLLIRDPDPISNISICWSDFSSRFSTEMGPVNFRDDGLHGDKGDDGLHGDGHDGSTAMVWEDPGSSSVRVFESELRRWSSHVFFQFFETNAIGFCPKNGEETEGSGLCNLCLIQWVTMFFTHFWSDWHLEIGWQDCGIKGFKHGFCKSFGGYTSWGILFVVCLRHWLLLHFPQPAHYRLCHCIYFICPFYCRFFFAQLHP